MSGTISSRQISEMGLKRKFQNTRLICADYELADDPYFTRSKTRVNMTDSGASDQNGLGLVTVLRDEPKTSEGMEPIPYNEHIANLMQKMANMQSEIDRLRNLTNLSITLNTPLLEHGTNTTTSPLFPHVDSHTPQYFPPTLNNPTFHKTIRNKPTLYLSLPHMRPKLHLPKLQSSKPTHLPKLPRLPKPPYLPKNIKQPNMYQWHTLQPLMFNMCLKYM
ncbi:hypothetical protein H5410_001194 [Solanum commersonii]|uniref:Uncharacterized protein n=1 Tax=Solanum commersonii TaxID=4109 RepID=A0A9J6AXZ6_SOLCO|nr:hypothetical protein H5410_001194 [Solanum commersonii]